MNDAHPNDPNHPLRPATAATAKPAASDPVPLTLDLAGALKGLDSDTLQQFAALRPDLASATAPDFFEEIVPPIPDRQPPRGTEQSVQLDELADDMLSLLKRVKSLEELQGRVVSQLDQLQTAIQQAAETSARESDALRRELLGQRKHAAQMSAFQAVVTGQERLQIMRGELHERKDARMLGQLDAVLQTLGTMLRGLGFVEFRAEPQEPFDPTRMECLGYAPGKPNVVLKCIRSGYRADQTVVRPAGVIIANPPQN